MKRSTELDVLLQKKNQKENKKITLKENGILKLNIIYKHTQK